MKPSPVKPTASFEDFEKLDIRIGTIISVEEVPRSNKLMKLTVDFGDHTRTILAGIKKERENPTEIEGKQALFVVNLPERKMAGELSLFGGAGAHRPRWKSSRIDAARLRGRRQWLSMSC
jgi:tRNA-binding protein